MELTEIRCMFAAVAFFIAPIASHRLVVGPPSPPGYDSVLVSSDPIKVTEPKKYNRSEPDYSIRFDNNVVPDRSSRSCKYNDISCLYGTETPKTDASGSQEIIDRFIEQYSSITNARFGIDLNRSDLVEKSYWDRDRPAHPFEDKKNWVTLETVPWSSSMVSKWQPNVQPTFPSPSTYETGLTHQRPSHDKPWNYGSTTGQSNRPLPVTTNYGSYIPVSGPKPNYQWGVGNNEIITDNRPTNFPQSPSFPSYRPPTHQASQIYPGIKRHPSTYPEAGNGEWVLLSTTKGYSQPNGYRGQGKTIKPEISRYHEEDIEDNPISNRRTLNLNENLREENGIIYANGDGRKGKSRWSMEDSPLQILYSSPKKEPDVTVRRAVRLQILPPLSNETALAHDGLVEVDPSYHNVEDEHKALEDEKIKELSKIAKIKRNNLNVFRLIPASRLGPVGKRAKDNKAAVLAAVGAGMIPATMAVLVPVALGRKKRSAIRESYNP